MRRRNFLRAPALLAPGSVRADSGGRVIATGDGIPHSPAEYAALLAKLGASAEADSYSRGGVIAKLEAKMAAVLGKEAAVWFPTGTLANHVAARLLAGAPAIPFLFAGGGAGRAAHDRAIAHGCAAHIAVRPYLPRAALGLGLTAPDAHLVTLRPALEGLIVPSKVYGAMAAGRPILFVGDPDGEVARLARAHDCGLVIPAGDAAGLAAAIRALRDDPGRRARLGANARAAFERCFDRARAVAAWRAVLGV